MWLIRAGRGFHLDGRHSPNGRLVAVNGYPSARILV
jgi:hypothetical protein